MGRERQTGAVAALALVPDIYLDSHLHVAAARLAGSRLVARSEKLAHALSTSLARTPTGQPRLLHAATLPLE